MNNLDCIYLPFWKWRDTASNWEAKETEQRWPRLSLEITFAWHFHYHLFPEDSFVQRRRKQALALTWNAKWWMGLTERMTQRQTLCTGGINQVSIGSGAPSAWAASASRSALFSLRLPACTAPSWGWQLACHMWWDATGIMTVSFLTVCRWSNFLGFRLISCSACLQDEKTIISEITSN